VKIRPNSSASVPSTGSNPRRKLQYRLPLSEIVGCAIIKSTAAGSIAPLFADARCEVKE
jgi:hypothetical protein